MPRLVVATLVAALLVFPTSGSAKKRLSVAPLYYDTSNVCTAWSLNEPKALWVTAAHCVMGGEDELEEDEALESPTAPAHTYRIADQVATITQVSAEHDLALLTTAKGAEALVLAEKGPKVGDEVTALGFPLGGEQPLFSRGVVSNLAYRTGPATLAWFALPLCQGHSGSPIFNKHHEVVSVFQRMTAVPCAPFALGPTWETLVALLGPLTENR